MPQPLKDAFCVNPDEKQLKIMHDKDAARMQNFKDVADDAVRSIRAATLIVVGDQDIVKPEHAIELHPNVRVAYTTRWTQRLPGEHGRLPGNRPARIQCGSGHKFLNIRVQ